MTAKSVPLEVIEMSPEGKMADQYSHVKHCTTHPKFLHSNSTSHRWAFGAIAELIDNALDPDVSASQFCIDMKEFHGEPCLVFMDNGSGLTPERLHKMLSFGHSNKQMTMGDRSIGKHGNGFKSGTMRLGKDVLVLSKCATSMTAGFLSQTFLLESGAEDILIPRVSWDLNGNRLCNSELDTEESLTAICDYSIFPDEESLLAQLEAIPQTGAILIISNLRRHEGHLELDFKTDPHDIRITSEITASNYQQLRPNQPNSVDVITDYSLRAYVAILYKVPRMQIFIRDKKVKTKRISGILSQKETETYKPLGLSESLKIELGFNTENKNLYGMMLYHRNRLVKAYVRVGIQLEENERGMGVIGIVEADFLQPTHNKQDFDDTIAYRRLLKKLSEVLAEYWWEKRERAAPTFFQVEPQIKRPDQGQSSDDVPDTVWVQCDNPSCLKWRVLPSITDPASLPDIWYCKYHPDPKYQRHEEPEQEWDASIPHEIVERRKARKREYDRERKEREAKKKRQRLEAACKEEELTVQKERENVHRFTEEKLSREREAQEQERSRQEEEVKILLEECNAMKAKQKEMLEQQNELQRQLHLANEEKARIEETAMKNKSREEQKELAALEYELLQRGIVRTKQQEETARLRTLKLQQDEFSRQEKGSYEEAARKERERKDLEARQGAASIIKISNGAQQQVLQRKESWRRDEHGEHLEESFQQEIATQYRVQHVRELGRQIQRYEAQEQELLRQAFERGERLGQDYEAQMSEMDQSHSRNVIEGGKLEDNLLLPLVTHFLRKGSAIQKAYQESQRSHPNVVQQDQYLIPEAMQEAQVSSQVPAPTSSVFGSWVSIPLQGSHQSHGIPFKHVAANGMSIPVQRYEGYQERQTSTSRSIHPAASTLVPPTPSPTHMHSYSSVNSSVSRRFQNGGCTSSSTTPTVAQHLRQTLSSNQAAPQVVSSDQGMNILPLAASDSVSEIRVQGLSFERGEIENQLTAQHSGTLTANRGDIYDQQANTVSDHGRPGDPQASGMPSVHFPLDSGLSNASTCATDGSLDQVVYALQRQLRMALNTLAKLGALEPSVLEFNPSPSTDLEVVSICEKAKRFVEMRFQGYSVEISDLKRQLASYNMSNLQRAPFLGFRLFDLRVQNRTFTYDCLCRRVGRGGQWGTLVGISFSGKEPTTFFCSSKV